ncbi:MAG: hypothetical protein R3F59_21280 [Myxococcota bacterium]
MGETKDLQAQWAPREVGLPYRVVGLDHTAGDLDSEGVRADQPVSGRCR